VKNQPNDTQGQSAGHLFIISAPSGAGKSTLCRALLAHFTDLKYSVSHTTRAPRKGEQEGIDYHFISQEKFKQMIDQGAWVEWAKVHGEYYGTSAVYINSHLRAGRDVLLDIDVQGAAQIVALYPDCIPIFVMPPSISELKRRLEKRGTDNLETIEKRMAEAENEIRQKDRYRYVVINDRLENAVDELIAIVGKFGQD
jgi:guanylate kinase